ncbi:MAG: anti-sigma factor family protein, partial [Candidatus Omnitrophota bacterium]
MCKFDKLLLSRFWDGGVSAEEIGIVSKHLESCTECQQEVGRIKLLTLALNKLPEVEISDDYDFKFQKRLQEHLEKEKGLSVLKVFAERVKAGLEDLIRIFTPQPALVKIGL